MKSPKKRKKQQEQEEKESSTSPQFTFDIHSTKLPFHSCPCGLPWRHHKGEHAGSTDGKSYINRISRSDTL